MMIFWHITSPFLAVFLSSYFRAWLIMHFNMPCTFIHLFTGYLLNPYTVPDKANETGKTFFSPQLYMLVKGDRCLHWLWISEGTEWPGEWWSLWMGSAVGGEGCSFRMGKPGGGRGVNRAAVWGGVLQAEALTCEGHRGSHGEWEQRALGESTKLGATQGLFWGVIWVCWEGLGKGCNSWLIV